MVNMATVVNVICCRWLVDVWGEWCVSMGWNEVMKTNEWESEWRVRERLAPLCQWVREWKRAGNKTVKAWFIFFPLLFPIHYLWMGERERERGREEPEWADGKVSKSRDWIELPSAALLLLFWMHQERKREILVRNLWERTLFWYIPFSLSLWFISLVPCLIPFSWFLTLSLGSEATFECFERGTNPKRISIHCSHCLKTRKYMTVVSQLDKWVIEGGLGQGLLSILQ